MFGDTAVYNIKITGGGEETGNSTKPQEMAKPNPQDPTKPKGTGRERVNLFALYALGSRVAHYASSNVEAYTRNAQLQEQVNTGMKLVGYGIAIATNPAIGISLVAVDLATQALTYAKQTKESNLVAEQFRRRSGNVNRSRA